MESRSTTLSLVGAGNVANHFALALTRNGYCIEGIYSRTAAHAQALAAQCGAKAVPSLAALPHSDIVLLCTRDDSIPAIASELAAAGCRSLVAHTAGSVPLSALSNRLPSAGVIYPLQTFSKERALDFRRVPLFVEGSSEQAAATLRTLAHSLAERVETLDSDRRRQLHLAAVFACNFANRCFDIGAQLLEASGIAPELLQPLIRETVEKLNDLTPREAQTGPAVRYDRSVLDAQLALLSGDETTQRVYRALTESIHQRALQLAPPHSHNKPLINYDLQRIRALAFDVDGVLSSNYVMLSDSLDQPQRTANIKDGYALQLAVKCGLQVAIITGGRSEAVRRRYVALGLQNVFMGVSVKITCFQQWLEESELQADQVLYMGDDVPDYEVMRACGCPCCPADAAPEIRSIATYVSQRNGGDGCARDVIEQVLRAQGHWMSSAEAFGW